MPEAFDLQRFLDAQATVYQNALSELRAGHKRTHWMWFIFPQVAGLGHSAMAQRYAISSRAEAQHYLEHPILLSVFANVLRRCFRCRVKRPFRFSVRRMTPSFAHR